MDQSTAPLLQDARPPAVREHAPQGKRAPKRKHVAKENHSQCYCFDLTLSAKDDKGEQFTDQQIHEQLRPLCKKYAFRLEKGEQTGYMHFQCRISLHKKARLNEAQTLFLQNGIDNFKLSVTNNRAKGDAFYIEKAQTGVGKLQTDKDYVPPGVFTKQLELFPEPMPWGVTLAKILEPFDMRSIHFVVCKRGAEGKSMFVEWMEYHRKGFEIPPMRLFEDIMQCVCDSPVAKTYMVDFPRCMNKTKLFDFYSGMEYLKNGKAYDKRYHFKKTSFDRPNICIFSNYEPPTDIFTRDRWRFWTIHEHELCHYEKIPNPEYKEGGDEPEEIVMWPPRRYVDVPNILQQMWERMPNDRA